MILKQLKTKALKSSKLFNLACLFINLKYMFYNRKYIKGKRNKINTAKNSLYRKVKYKVDGNNNQITIGNRCILKNMLFEIEGNNNIVIINDSVNFMERGTILIQGDNCNISIGKGSVFRDGDMFAGESDTNIEIGDNCLCGIVSCSTSDFHSVIDLDSGKRINPPDSIKIGNENWITNHVLIRKGAEIKDYTIVSPYSLINKKFSQSNIILAGQPAKIIKENITWSREKLPY